MTVGAVLTTPAPLAVTPAQTRVLLVAEGTYPHAWGGVSTWCDLLVRSLPDVRFWVWAITPRPGLSELYGFPGNVEQVVTVPLWNVRDQRETWPRPGLRSLHRARAAVDEATIRSDFLPPFRAFVHACLVDHYDPLALAHHIHALHRYLLDHDLDATLGRPLVWDAYIDEIRSAASPRPLVALTDPLLVDASTGYAWLTRWLFPIAREIPRVDVVHAAMAGLCCMTAAAAVLEHDAGFLLTEHGVYLREQYLAAASQDRSPFLKALRLRFARRMTELGYALAGQVSPCCDYNQRWECEVGADASRLATIYYGMDNAAFSAERPLSEQPRTVVWVGRINPLKDVETLLRAAAVALRRRPEMQFRLYGSAPAEDADYHAHCVALHEELGLGDSVTFCGYTATPVDAYNEADIVVMSSVSEGLPFSILEAMACGRPIVATAVGGIPEGIEGAGIAVEPRNPQALGEAILALADDPARCHALGATARERATHLFGLDRFAADHRSSYRHLSRPSEEGSVATVGGAPRPASQPRHARGDHVPRLWHLYVVGRHDDEPGAAFVELRRLVQAIDPHPFDRFEVAAIIESGGVTDAVARERYNFPDTFSLAGALFETMHRSRAIPDSATGLASPPRGAAQRRAADADRADVASLSHLDSARHPTLAVLPSAALLSTIWLLSSWGGFSSDQVLALALGMTTGMLCTNGIALGMGRRASRMVSLGKATATGRFLAVCTLLGVAGTACFAWGVTRVGVPGVSAIAAHSGTFVLAAASIAAVWVLAAALSLVGRAGWTGLALVAGVLVGAGVRSGTSALTSASLVLGVLAGLTIAIATMGVALGAELAARSDAERDADRTLPSLTYMLLEATPYFLYGSLGVVMFASVHIIGWVAAGAAMPQVGTLELGLFLTLGPVMLAAGLAERALRLFWLRAARSQATTRVSRAEEFNATLATLFRARMSVYLTAIVLLSLLTAVTLEALAHFGLLTGFFPTLDVAVFREVYLSSLVAFGLLGWAQYVAMYGMALARWRGSLFAIAVGAALTIVVGIAAVVLLGYGGAPLGLVVGAAAYTAIGLASARRVLEGIDHVYVHAL